MHSKVTPLKIFLYWKLPIFEALFATLEKRLVSQHTQMLIFAHLVFNTNSFSFQYYPYFFIHSVARTADSTFAASTFAAEQEGWSFAILSIWTTSWQTYMQASPGARSGRQGQFQCWLPRFFNRKKTPSKWHTVYFLSLSSISKILF